MLKFKQKSYTSMFRKQTIKQRYINYRTNSIFLQNSYNINIKILYSVLLKIKKRFKKKKYYMFINCRNNHFLSYKSKNARMGKGKGALLKANIKHNSHLVGWFKLMSRQTQFIILKTLKYNLL